VSREPVRVVGRPETHAHDSRLAVPGVAWQVQFHIRPDFRVQGEELIRVHLDRPFAGESVGLTQIAYDDLRVFTLESVQACRSTGVPPPEVVLQLLGQFLREPGVLQKTTEIAGHCVGERRGVENEVTRYRSTFFLLVPWIEQILRDSLEDRAISITVPSS